MTSQSVARLALVALALFFFCAIFLSAATVSAQTCAPKFVTTIRVGAHPKAIAVDPATHRSFVALFDSSSVAVIDTARHQLVATWATDGRGNANGIAFADGRVYVTKRDTANVSVLDTTTGNFIGNIAVGALPYGASAANHRVYIANFGSGTASILEAMNPAADSLKLGTYPSFVAPLNDLAYISLWEGAVAIVGADGALRGKIDSLGTGTFGIAANANTHRVFIANRESHLINVIDAHTNTRILTIYEIQTPYALAVNPVTNHLFVVLAENNLVRVRDATTLALIADLPIGAQGNAGGDGIAVVDNQVYIANNAEGTVTVLSDNCSASPPMPIVTPTRMPAPSISDGISVREETITLDAYPYDSFWRDAYDATYNIAYKQFDQFAYRAAPRSTTPRNFKTVIIENDYLRLTFLPELGGRLWQVFYKPTQQNVFYNNRVLKPSPWGPAQQGGWLAAGGMEWALPVDEHGYEWGVPWSYTITRTPGSATITLQDSTATDRVRAKIAVTLMANAAYFTVHPRVENLTRASVPLQFWLNAQIALNEKNVSPETEFVLPANAVYVHSTTDDFIPREYVPPDGAWSPVTPMPWSIVAGRDLSRYRDWENYLGVFVAPSVGAQMYQPMSFAGAYDHANALGIVRVFPRTAAPGVKLFAFGPEFSERLEFSDDGSDYFELWGGLPRTFFHSDDATLAAGASREWDEYWIPFARIGGLTEATRNAVLSLNVDANGNAAIGVAATTRGTRGSLMLYRDGVLARRWDIVLEPGNPFRTQASGQGNGNFKLQFLSNQVNIMGTR